jgi:hypothetical protein
MNKQNRIRITIRRLGPLVSADANGAITCVLGGDWERPMAMGGREPTPKPALDDSQSPI